MSATTPYLWSESRQAGANIRLLRERQDPVMTQGDLVAQANIDGLGKKQLSKVENGGRLLKEAELHGLARVLVGDASPETIERFISGPFDGVPDPEVPPEPEPPTLEEQQKHCPLCVNGSWYSADENGKGRWKHRRYIEPAEPRRLCLHHSDILDSNYRQEMLNADNEFQWRNQALRGG